MGKLLPYFDGCTSAEGGFDLREAPRLCPRNTSGTGPPVENEIEIRPVGRAHLKERIGSREVMDLAPIALAELRALSQLDIAEKPALCGIRTEGRSRATEAVFFAMTTAATSQVEI